jgi:hypothetical protein
MNKSAYLSRLLASLAIAVAFALPSGPSVAEPSHGDYIGKSMAEITENLARQGFKFSESNREDGNLLESEVIRDGRPYEIFADPKTGKIVKIITGDETNEIPIIKCTQRSEFVRYLADNYTEKPVAIGFTSNDSVTELLQSTNGASWTLIKTTPNGISCQIAAGNYWQAFKREVTQEQ